MNKGTIQSSRGLMESHRYYEDCQIGEEFVSPTRTITETDVVVFAAFSGDYSEMHTSKEFAKKTIYGERVAHGLLGLTIAQGLEIRGGIDKIVGVASLGWTWDFRAPIKIGDTVYTKFKLRHKRRTKKPSRGIFYLFGQLINQREEVIQEGEHRLMVEARRKEQI